MSHFEIFMTYVVPIIFGIIILVGLIGNLMVVAVVYLKELNFKREKKKLYFHLPKNAGTKNSPTNILILNLALTDILFLGICVPATAVTYYLGNWPFGSPACKIVQYLIYATAYASIYTLVLMSMDRYLAIVHPFTLSVRYRNKKNVLIAIVVCWILILCGNIQVLVSYQAITERFFKYGGPDGMDNYVDNILDLLLNLHTHEHHLVRGRDKRFFSNRSTRLDDKGYLPIEYDYDYLNSVQTLSDKRVTPISASMNMERQFSTNMDGRYSGNRLKNTASSKILQFEDITICLMLDPWKEKVLFLTFFVFGLALPLLIISLLYLRLLKVLWNKNSATNFIDRGTYKINATRVNNCTIDHIIEHGSLFCQFANTPSHILPTIPLMYPGCKNCKLTPDVSTKKLRRKRAISWRKVTKMVIIIVLAFVACWFPIHIIFFVIHVIGYHNKTILMIQAVTQCLAYMNSCLNPILYSLLSDNFKDGYKQLIAMICRLGPKWVEKLCCGVSADKYGPQDAIQPPYHDEYRTFLDDHDKSREKFAQRRKKGGSFRHSFRRSCYKKGVPLRSTSLIDFNDYRLRENLVPHPRRNL